MTIPKLIAFDLDGTLAESKQPLTPEMAALLASLLARTNVAIASGGALAQFKSQVVAKLPSDAKLANLYLLPTSGAALYVADGKGEWTSVYEERISEADAATVSAAIRAACDATGLVDFSAPSFGERIEYRGSQVTISTLGQQAPVDLKKAWDADRAKRVILQAEIAKRLPAGFKAAIGGTTSIDVTREGIDKAYGMEMLCKHIGIDESEALYVGDELRENGNDAAVLRTHAQTHRVADVAETIRLISDFVS